MAELTLSQQLASLIAQQRVEDLRQRLEQMRNAQIEQNLNQTPQTVSQALSAIPQISQMLLQGAQGLKAASDQQKQDQINKLISVGDVQGLNALAAKDQSPGGVMGFLQNMLGSQRAPTSVDLSLAKMKQDEINTAKLKAGADLSKTNAETQKLLDEAKKAEADGRHSDAQALLAQAQAVEAGANTQKALAEADKAKKEAADLVGPTHLPQQPIETMSPQQIADYESQLVGEGVSVANVQKTIDLLWDGALKKLTAGKDSNEIQQITADIALKKGQTAEAYANANKANKEAAMLNAGALKTDAAKEILPTQTVLNNIDTAIQMYQKFLTDKTGLDAIPGTGKLQKLANFMGLPVGSERATVQTALNNLAATVARDSTGRFNMDEFKMISGAFSTESDPQTVLAVLNNLKAQKQKELQMKATDLGVTVPATPPTTATTGLGQSVTPTGQSSGNAVDNIVSGIQ